jgi:hypothetical protein
MAQLDDGAESLEQVQMMTSWQVIESKWFGSWVVSSGLNGLNRFTVFDQQDVCQNRV